MLRQVPGHEGTPAGLAADDALLLERLQCLPDGDPADAVVRHQLGLGRHLISGSIAPGEDLLPEDRAELVVEGNAVGCEPRFRLLIAHRVSSRGTSAVPFDAPRLPHVV